MCLLNVGMRSAFKEVFMLKRIHRLKSKRGFTMIEMIVVVGIIAIMVGMVLGSSNTTRDKIKEANQTAADFYSAVQTEFTNLQMFDGPLTMTLNDKYTNNLSGITSPNGAYNGIKYYPLAGGNYPFNGTLATGETHETGTPKKCELYIEMYCFNGKIRRVNYASTLNALLSYYGDGNKGTELCLVLQNELQDRMEYQDGYYYAKISYDPTNVLLKITPTKNDFRETPVRVEWTAYCGKEISTASMTTTFKKQNILRSGSICGVYYTMSNWTLGETGTVFS